MPTAPTVPGVYRQPRPRQPEAPFVRTDVAGMIGFEPRLRDAGSGLTGGPPAAGHRFAVTVAGFELELGGRAARVPAVAALELSADPAAIPLADGEAIAFAVAAARTGGGHLVVHAAGAVAAAGLERAPEEGVLAAATAVLRDGTTPSELLGGPPPTGHAFRADVAPFLLEVGGEVVEVGPVVDLVLSSDPASIPLADGEAILYAVAVARVGSAVELVAAAGRPAAAGREAPPSDDQVRSAVRAAVRDRPWERIADLRITRTGDAVALAAPPPVWARLADMHLSRQGNAVRASVRPALGPVRLDDLRDAERRLGPPPDDGTLLADALRAYFANGGRRVWVALVRRPDPLDPADLEAARQEMVGVPGAGEREATGLERLLRVHEVSFVDVPDLYAGRTVHEERALVLPGSSEDARFRPCDRLSGATGGTALGAASPVEPLYDDADVLDAQLRMLARTADERWRLLLLLAVPLELDPAAGRFAGPSLDKARRWRLELDAAGETPERMSCAALYHPWVLAQWRADGEVVERPPTPFAAGVIARRDLARGPHVAPANEALRGVVGLTLPVDDRVHGELYEPPSNVNLLRAFPGRGVEVWGARTLSADRWLRYLPVRRCLSAIERQAFAALEPLVFEPSTPLLWLQVSQQMLAVLLPLFEAGMLRGERPEQAFYVRCDRSVNPPEEVEAGRLVCEAGVAVAAPAEFLVFRLGRREGVVEVLE